MWGARVHACVRSCVQVRVRLQCFANVNSFIMFVSLFTLRCGAWGVCSGSQCVSVYACGSDDSLTILPTQPGRSCWCHGGPGRGTCRRQRAQRSLCPWRGWRHNAIRLTSITVTKLLQLKRHIQNVLFTQQSTIKKQVGVRVSWSRMPTGRLWTFACLPTGRLWTLVIKPRTYRLGIPPPLATTPAHQPPPWCTHSR